MFLEDMVTQLTIVIIGSLVGSTIFSLVFLKILRRSIVSSATNLISEDTKEKAADFLQSTVKNGFSDALRDPKIKTILLEVLELVREKLIKEEDESIKPEE